MLVVDVKDVWKRFRIPHEKRTTMIDNMAGILSIFDRGRYSFEEFWALKKVDFQIKHGESLGIIGPNGSGKSTLLKIIARVMKPDRGRIVTNGSIASVLELGIGFHGDLTVRENTIIYGVIMGLTRSELKRRTNSILEFAGLTRFQDARLKTLSSGMQVRLAFSIAIQMEADIYLVDEALAVGDVEFQEKCLNKFREFKNEEKSIILVSHSMKLVRDFCDKTLYLADGMTRSFGPSRQVTNQYLADMKPQTESR